MPSIWVDEMKKRENHTVTKTRNKFISVAREVFAEKGFQAATMNEIAERAGKGRRTLYNYFGTKNDVYLAVIQEELEYMYEKLKDFVQEPIPPSEKLIEYIARRQQAVREVVLRNGTLGAEFFNDISTVERARVRFDVLERRLIRQILQEGILEGSFRIVDLDRTALLLHSSMKGLEVPFIRGQLGRTDEALLKTFRVVKGHILNALKK